MRFSALAWLSATSSAFPCGNGMGSASTVGGGGRPSLLRVRPQTHALGPALAAAAHARRSRSLCPLCSCPSGDVPPGGFRAQPQPPRAPPNKWGHNDRVDVHPESWELGNGNFAASYLEAQKQAQSRPIVGEDPMAIGRALVKSRTEQDRRQDAEDRRARQDSGPPIAAVATRAAALAPRATVHAPHAAVQPDAVPNSSTATPDAVVGTQVPQRAVHLSSETLGVGGMEHVVEAIRRRVWVPLSAPKSLLADFGVAPVSGLLLHGPPGCGKSLLARRLAELLTPRAPTFVSGPEILDRFVGSSEANVRSLFDFPPPLPAGTPGAEEALHVIVLDEFDAIAGKRSAGGGGDGSERVRDSVVNQLLSRMDGVQQMAVPTLLVGLTNRKDLIDPALLRPGRFEVHIEVSHPDCRGRAEILRIHCQRMWSAGRMEVPKWSEGGFTAFLTDLAERTEGLSGAELAGVVRAAVAYALDRAAMAGYQDAASVKATMQDFERGLQDVLPTTTAAAGNPDSQSSGMDVGAGMGL